MIICPETNADEGHHQEEVQKKYDRGVNQKHATTVTRDHFSPECEVLFEETSWLYVTAMEVTPQHSIVPILLRT